MTRRLRQLSAVFVAGLLAVSAAVAADENQVIFPGGSPKGTAPAPAAGGGMGLTTIVGVILLAGAGGWLLWRGRSAKFTIRDTQALTLSETRSLGNRQYLVVASYEDKKFLLSVCPGRIEMLAPLHDPAPAEKPRS